MRGASSNAPTGVDRDVTRPSTSATRRLAGATSLPSHCPRALDAATWDLEAQAAQWAWGGLGYCAVLQLVGEVSTGVHDTVSVRPWFRPMHCSCGYCSVL